MTTTSHDLKAASRDFFAAIDADQAQTIPAVLAEGLVATVPGMPPMDRVAFQQLGQLFYGAFPDMRHHIESQVQEGDTVVNRIVARGTHRGDFQGIPPTGKEVAVHVVSIQRFAGDRIVDAYLIFDALGLLQQLGAVPAPA